jgi:hypothetical protein
VCVLEAKKIFKKLQLLLYLPLKQAETGKLSIQNLKKKKKKKGWNPFTYCFITAPTEVKGDRQNVG